MEYGAAWGRGLGGAEEKKRGRRIEDGAGDGNKRVRNNTLNKRERMRKRREQTGEAKKKGREARGGKTKRGMKRGSTEEKRKREEQRKVTRKPIPVYINTRHHRRIEHLGGMERKREGEEAETKKEGEDEL